MTVLPATPVRVLFALLACATAAHATSPTTFLRDAGWCWFQDPRALIHDGKLVVGGVSGRSGDVRVGVYNLAADAPVGEVVLHEAFEVDDHDAPAFYARSDGGLLAVYAKHGREPVHYLRVAEPGDYLCWGATRVLRHDDLGRDKATYMNLYTGRGGSRLYNFFRGVAYNPTVISSDDEGHTWSGVTHLIADEVAGRNRPYVRYVQRDADTVGVAFTEAHPRNFGNSLYYVDFRDDAFFRVDGARIKALGDGPLVPAEAERIFRGGGERTDGSHGRSAARSAWASSVAVDTQGRPHLAYTLYLSNDDHRYRIASWDGRRWRDREVAFAGTCLYPRESSYTGLITLDPSDPRRVWISTNVDPTTGADLGGTYEVYSATIDRDDDVESIDWRAVTNDSADPNLRPLIVAGEGYRVALWLRGPWKTYTNYESDIVGVVLQRPE